MRGKSLLSVFTILFVVVLLGSADAWEVCSLSKSSLRAHVEALPRDILLDLAESKIEDSCSRASSNLRASMQTNQVQEWSNIHRQVTAQQERLACQVRSSDGVSDPPHTRSTDHAVALDKDADSREIPFDGLANRTLLQRRVLDVLLASNEGSDGQRRTLLQTPSADVSNATFLLLQQIFAPLCTWENGCTCFNNYSPSILRPVCGSHWVSCTPGGELTEIFAPICGLDGTLSEEISVLRTLKKIDLSDNQLTGSIPPSLSNLAELQNLDLSNNQLTGSIPPTLGNLNQLQTFDLSTNQLTGSIPPTLGYLGQLQNLKLFDNLLTGSIPPSLGNLTLLHGLDLSNNQLTGNIPPTLGNLTQLETLYLYNNQLTSSITPTLGNLTQLHDLSANQLTGIVTPTLGNLAQLQTLDLSNNQLTGSIPPTLGNLNQLQTLDLSYNQLTGSIPPTLGYLAGLLKLYLDHNQLSDEIPSSIGDMVGIIQIDLGFNNLTGSIPSLGNLQALTMLSLGNNQLTGRVPNDITSLQQLVSIDLGENSLCGPFPVGSWPELAILDLHRNCFEGNLNFIQGCPLLQVAYMAENSFSGPIPDLSLLSQLQFMMFYDNNLTEGVPTWVFSLPMIEGVFLGSNPLGGELHVSEMVSSLVQLDLSNCSLSGPLPDSISFLTNLTYLSLTNNYLEGVIPESLTSLIFVPPQPGQGGNPVMDLGSPGHLKQLLLANNQLTGAVPTTLFALTYPYLSLEFQPCTGVGPSSLSVVDLSNNQLSGTLPTSGFFTTDDCGNINFASRNLVELTLDNNNLTGTVSSDVLLPPMSLLSLSGNQFTGPIPVPVSGFTNIRSIDLSNNSFSGVIPSEYAGVSGLASLIVSGNPSLSVNCSSNTDTTIDSHCLPSSLLTVSNSIQQSFSGGLICNSVVSSRPSLSVQLDQQTYLRGVQCFCNDSTYQIPRSTSAWAGTPSCGSCGSSGWCECSTDNYAMINCWASDEPIKGWQPLECPYIASPSITACQLPLAAVCLPGDLTCQCAEGYEGRRCTDCSDGFFSSSRNCERCDPSLHILLPIVWILAIAGYTVYLVLVPGSASGILKVTIFFGQSLLLLTQNARVPWPAVLRRFLHSSSETGCLSATAIECVIEGIPLSHRYIVYALTPVLLVIICVLVFVFCRLRRLESAYDIFVYMILSMLLTTYFSVTIKALSGVSCTLPDGYLNAYPWISCDSGISPEFSQILGWSITCLIVYTVGVPLFAGYHLVRKRTQLTESHIARRLGFIVGSYRADTFWWEYVLIVRRLLLAAAVTIVPFTQQQLSSAIIMTVLVVSIALQSALRPFATMLENRLELVSLYVLLLAFLGVYVSESSAGTLGSLDWLPVVVIVIVSITAIVLAAATVLVLLLRILPSFANSSLGQRIVTKSEVFGTLVAKTDELRVRLLQSTDTEMKSQL